MQRAAVFFALFIVVIIILADTDHLPRSIEFIYDFPDGDKVGHFILFGLLNLFATAAALRSFPNRTPRRLALTIGLILAILIGLEEFSQKLFEARTFDLLDLLAGYLGLIAGGSIALRSKERGSVPRG